MRYTKMREWLSRSSRDMRSRDMRNPYGSRGGYVTSDRRGRDYGYDRMGDMASNGQYSRQQGDRNYGGQDYARGGGSNQYSGQSGRDYYGDMNYYPIRRMGTFDYSTYGSDEMYDMRDGRDYNYDMRYSRDYGNEEYKLTPSEIRKWDKELKRNGASMSVEQVHQIAQQQGIRFDEFSPELLTAVANMIESDYGDTIKADPMMYVKLAKDFLCDEDFDGTPEEKAYLYYTVIVNKEDD